MRLRRPEALLYFPVIIIGGMVTLGGLAWLYEKTRKKISHPRLGTLTYYGDHWVATIPHYEPGKPAVRLEIPGSRKAPDNDDLERFEALWPGIATLVETIRPHAVVDLEDAHDAVLGTNDEVHTRTILERIAGDQQQLDSDWVLSAVSIYRGQRQGRYWCLEFEVSWDGEHQRSAYLDMDGAFLCYDLSCTMVDL